MNQNLEAALAYAAIGRPVFPLVPNSKRPATPRGFHDATTDADQLEEWWGPHPGRPNGLDYGVGLPTGNGLVVIDVDVQHGGELSPNWPATLTAVTRSGGWHLFYAVDREVPNSVGRLGRGIDVRGEGGYVVAWPTPGWRFVNDMPPAAIDTALLIPIRGQGSGLLESWEAFEPADDGAISSGGRNDYLARYGGWLIRRGIKDFDELLPMIRQENERVCQPQLPADEVYALTRSVSRYA